MGQRFLRSVAKVLAKPFRSSEGEAGRKGFAREVLRSFRKIGSPSVLLQEILALALIDDERAKQLGSKIAAEIEGSQPEVVRQRIAEYLASMPESVRAWFRRAEDPRGLTPPPAFAVKRPEDLAPLLAWPLPKIAARGRGRSAAKPTSEADTHPSTGPGWGRSLLRFAFLILIAAGVGAGVFFGLEQNRKKEVFVVQQTPEPKELKAGAVVEEPKQEEHVKRPLDPPVEPPPEAEPPVKVPPKKVETPPPPPPDPPVKVSPDEEESRRIANGIAAEWRMLPPTRGPRHADVQRAAAMMPVFPLKTLAAYRVGEPLEITRKKAEQDPEAFPLRKAFFEAATSLEKCVALPMPEEYIAKDKAKFTKVQKDFGIATFSFEQAVDAIGAIAEKRELESSKRWRAHFDYAHARMLARLAFCYEYNAAVARTKGDGLPELGNNGVGWVLQPMPKLSCPERRARDSGKAAKELYRKIGEEYPNTPWAWLAAQEANEPLGLDWKIKEK